MSSEIEITEKEFAIITEIHKNHLPDQRTLAHRTGISLGLTNVIVKRLIAKGYVKAKQLNKKKIQYLLTPKGFSEKVNKSYNFALKVVDNFKIIKEKLQELILEEQTKGAVEFIIFGNSEICDIVEMAFINLNGKAAKYTKNTGPDQGHDPALLQVISSRGIAGSYSIDVLAYLSESGLFY
jgi:DNA-binding MarR family transcriptional regulator